MIEVNNMKTAYGTVFAGAAYMILEGSCELGGGGRQSECEEVQETAR